MKAWTQAHLTWVKSAVHFEHAAQEATLRDYVHEVDHGVVASSGSSAPSTRRSRPHRIACVGVIAGAPGAARDRAGLGRHDCRGSGGSSRALPNRAS